MHTRTNARSAQPRHTGTDDRSGRTDRPPNEEFGITVDGAVAYSLRLIPSNKVLGRFPSTPNAWSAVLAEIDAGRAPRTLVLDWHGVDGSCGRVSGGLTLEYLARSGLGLPADHLRSQDQRRR
jgi:hypothetical protein